MLAQALVPGPKLVLAVGASVNASGGSTGTGLGMRHIHLAEFILYPSITTITSENFFAKL